MRPTPAASSARAQNGIYIDNCTVTGTISAETSESFCRVGGLAASVLRGLVTNCGTDVEISGITDTNHVYAGGLYGMDNRVTTFNCYALGNVTGNSTNNNKVHLGGLVGQGGGIHYNCYAAGDIISLKSTPMQALSTDAAQASILITTAITTPRPS